MQKTVAMGADGAAVNLGKRGGVSVKLQEEAGKHIIPFHCMPHRLELALLSAQKDSPWVGNVYNLLHIIWKTYHFSSKSRRELKCLGVKMGVSVNNPSGVKGTRWLPHVSRALDVLLKQEKKEVTLEDSGQYTAVNAHMDHLAESSTNADVAGRAKHIKETMEDGSFRAFCHFLADLFSAISKYSLLLQRNDVILPQAVSSLRNLILNIEAMAVRPCPSGQLASFHAAMKRQRDAKEQEMQSQFMFRKQIETTVAAIVKKLRLRFSSLLCVLVFNHDVWPETAEKLVDYGIEEVTFLLDHFQCVLERREGLWVSPVSSCPTEEVKLAGVRLEQAPKLPSFIGNINNQLSLISLSSLLFSSVTLSFALSILLTSILAQHLLWHPAKRSTRTRSVTTARWVTGRQRSNHLNKGQEGEIFLDRMTHANRTIGSRY
ncbi:hypothetical protein DNTS_024407 [Danionella cerebrum]|uniref:DUF4371 domain-containing protein n=1 Tax=Danionella cerebrum TaxID=2873325 RepID=A0A553N207_9TELE|nr:hypothetical protein DNTS_024407 [Danionella translucida]